MQKRMLVLFGILLALFFLVGGYFINKNWHEHVKNQPQKFVYETFRGPSEPVAVLVIEDLDLKEPYLKYYEAVEAGIEPTLDQRIPLKGMPQHNPVYVIGYTKDSLLAEVISYYNRGAYFGGSYTQGWVYAKALHEKPYEED